ncbi:MAG: biopolymer transporter ExbD [Pseudomonadota bacterium]
MKLPREKSRGELVNITPLIDVVFILLVFFMLAGTIEQPDAVPVELAQSTSLDLSDANSEKDLIITLDVDGRIFIEEDRLSDNGLAERIAAELAWRPDTLIHLKADAQADAVRVIEVMERMRESGALYVVLITAGGGDGLAEAGRR